MKEFITSVMRNDRVWKWVRIDGIKKENYGYIENEIYYTNEYGFVNFRKVTTTMFDVHICMLKGAKEVDSFFLDCLEKMRVKGAEKFLGTIGDWNTPALKLALRCGFKEEGRISKAYQRDGKYRSMVMMGRT
jgi:hypothetical protein